MASTSTAERMAAAKMEAERLREAIATQRQKLLDADMATVCSESKKRDLAEQPSVKRTLAGHFQRVHAMHWAGDSIQLVSASQDGKLIVWNADGQIKVDSIPLQSQWVLTCAYEQSQNRMVASGGLDNNCSVYKVGGEQLSTRRPHRVLAAHDGYLSCCRFVTEATMLTSSGDSTSVLWDIETGDAKGTFHDHQGDVTRLCICPTNNNVFVSGSCDSSAKVWDIRTGECTMTFEGHVADVNDVDFMRNGTVFATASEDSSCRLFDLRANSQLASHVTDDIIGGAMGVSFSKSGRLLFAGYDDFNCFAWDVLNPGEHVYSMSKHTDRVSCLDVSPDGHGLCTGSWDTKLMIWA